MTDAMDYSHTMTVSDGLNIHYFDVNEASGAGAPVVLIHGYTANAEHKWFNSGVVDALKGNHRVIAIDCRGHGRSDQPHEPEKYGPQMAEDVIELMDHLGVEKAHVHGYSMGGGIVTQLLDRHLRRFITGAWGGSGVPETDPEWIEKVPVDEEGEDPAQKDGQQALQDSPFRDQVALDAVRAYPWKEGERTNIDLSAVNIPTLAINGGFDRPNIKTHRMARELADFTNVVIPGKSHLTVVVQEYIDALGSFIDRNDAGLGKVAAE